MARTMRWVACALALLSALSGRGERRADAETLESNRWVLHTMNGTRADELFEEQLPTIGFNFADSIVYGSSGCNRFFGTFHLIDNRLQTPHIASTRRACLSMEAENRFLTVFAGQGASLVLEKDEMLRLENEGIVLLFGKEND